MKTTILNTMNHAFTNEQILELLTNYPECEITNLKDIHPDIANALVNCSSDFETLLDIAIKLCAITGEYDKVVFPVGSPAFMFIFARIQATMINETQFMFAHSERASVEQTMDDGSVKKVNIFKHIKFIEL